MAEHSHHACSVYPAAAHEQQPVGSHQDVDKCSKDVDRGPVRAGLPAVLITRGVECQIQGCRLSVVSERAIDEHVVIVSGVLERFEWVRRWRPEETTRVRIVVARGDVCVIL